MNRSEQRKRIGWAVVNTASLIILGLTLQIGGAYIVNAAVNCMEGASGAAGDAADQYIRYMDAIRNIEPRQITHVVIVSPLIEEIVFRLIFLRAGRMVLPFWAANLVQAFLFGIYHGTSVQKVYGFVMGLIIGCVFYYCPIIYRNCQGTIYGDDTGTRGRGFSGLFDLPNSLMGFGFTFILHMVINTAGLFVAPLLPADLDLIAQFGLGISLMLIATGAVYCLWQRSLASSLSEGTGHE